MDCVGCQDEVKGALQLLACGLVDIPDLGKDSALKFSSPKSAPDAANSCTMGTMPAARLSSTSLTNRQGRSAHRSEQKNMLTLNSRAGTLRLDMRAAPQLADTSVATYLRSCE